MREAIATDEGGETKVREVEGEGEEKLDHHVVGATSRSVREDKVRGGEDEYA